MSEHQIDSKLPRVSEGPAMGRRQLMVMLSSAAAAAGLPRTAWSQEQPRKGGVLRVVMPANLSSTDPMAGNAGYDHPMLYAMFDTLIEWDYDALTAKPGLAKAWKYIDPKTLVLDLEAGVKFHDGTPLDAAAVKFNLDRSRGDQRSNVKIDLASINSVDVTGPLQVTLKLKQPDTALVLILSDRAGMMFSPKAAQSLGAGANRTAVGSGPWKFVSWTDDEKVVVARNEAYWRPNKPHLDGIEFYIMREGATALRSVMSGQNDFVYNMATRQKAVAERQKGVRAISNTTLYVHMFYLNLARPPLNDVRVRRAMNLAIDRDAFNKVTQAGIGEPATSLLPKAHWAHDPTLGEFYRYDPAQARKLLTEAGFPDGVELHIIGWTDQNSIQRQELLIDQMGKAGFRLKFENNALATSMFSEGKGHAYLAAFTGRPDPSQIYQTIFAKDSFLNPGKADPAAGRAEAQVQSQAVESLADRKVALAKLQRMVAEAGLYVPLVVQYDVQVMAEKVMGYKPNLLGKPKFENVWLKA